MIARKPDRLLILGCGGFIGSHILRRLLQDTDYIIDGVDLSNERIREIPESDRYTFHRMDLADFISLEPLLKSSDVVLSLAALCNPWLYTHSPIEVIESNFTKMYPVVEACSNYQCRLIHFSTSEVYGKTIQSYMNDHTSLHRNDWLLDEETSPLLLGPVHAQRWCYAAAKQLLERTIVAYGQERNLDYTIVRPFNFIGPGMDFIPGVDGEGVPRVLACFMDALLHGKNLQLVDDGVSRRTFTAIEDAVEATMSIIAQPEASSRQVFNVGHPENELTIKELADSMITMYREMVSEENCISETECVSSADFYGEGYEDSDRRVPSIKKINSLLGWYPRIGLHETLREAMSGFIAKYRNV